MTTEARPQVVRSFLSQLEAALVGVPGDISGEIVAGIIEELAGLDEATATARIEELGDPAFIAAEVRAGIPPVAAACVVPAPAAVGEPRWYVVLIALLVAFGGCVVPVLGWIVGIVMMWLSKSWFSWEKWVATVAPLAFAAIGFATFAISNRFGALTGWHLLIVLAFAIPVVAGLWLLWRSFRHPRPVQGKGLQP